MPHLKHIAALCILIAIGSIASAQVSVVPISNPKVQFFCDGGVPCAGGLLFSFAAGTSTQLATYQDLGATANTNPIVLDSNGMATIYLKSATAYKFVLQDSQSVQQWSQDNVLPGNTCWTQSGGSSQYCLNTVNNIVTWGPLQGSGFNANGNVAYALGYGAQFWSGTLGAGSIDSGLYRCAARVLCAGNGNPGDTTGAFEGVHFFVAPGTQNNPVSSTDYFVLTIPSTTPLQVGSVIHWRADGTYVSSGSGEIQTNYNSGLLDAITVSSTSSASWLFSITATCVVTTSTQMHCAEVYDAGVTEGSTSPTHAATAGNATIAFGSSITFALHVTTGWTGSLTLGASVVDVSY